MLKEDVEFRFINVPDGVKVDPKEHLLLSKLEKERGTSQYWRYGGLFPRLLYTDGIKTLAQEARCYWLLDILGSVFSIVNPYDRRRVHITVKDKVGAVVIYDIETDAVIYQQQLKYTDFPLAKLWFRFDNIPFRLPGGTEDVIHHLAYLISED